MRGWQTDLGDSVPFWCGVYADAARCAPLRESTHLCRQMCPPGRPQQPVLPHAALFAHIRACASVCGHVCACVHLESVSVVVWWPVLVIALIGVNGDYWGMAQTAAARPVEAWVDDLVWHRRMFQQSRYRWLPEDAVQIALRATGGTVEFTTPRQLQRLDKQLLTLEGFTHQIRHTYVNELRRARDALSPSDWGDALRYLGVSLDEAAFLFRIIGPEAHPGNDQTRRVTRGIPWVTPLSRAWELQQLLMLWDAACALVEDCVCDLVVELAADRGLSSLVGLTRDYKLIDLQWRIENNYEQRGDPGDPRRARVQTYATPDPP